MNDKAQALIERLYEITISHGDIDDKAILQAIKAIEVLTSIANSSWPHFYECGWQDHAEWCAKQARNYLESIK